MSYGKQIFSIFCLFFLLVKVVFSTTIDQIVVFGDSLSDNGNLFALTTNLHKVISKVPIVPKNPPYYQGRFCNGPNWIDNLSSELNVPVYDYAYGGSWAEPLLDSKLNIPFGLGIQVDMYLASAILDTQIDKHLFVVWTGNNDYASGRDDPEYSTTNTIATIKNNVEWLIYYGAKTIVIMNAPDLGRVPKVLEQGPEYAQNITRLSQLHNKKFAVMMLQLKAQYPDVNLITGDAMTYFSDILDFPAKYGFKNSTDACYKGGYYFRTNLANNPEIVAAKQQNIDILHSPSLEEAYVTAKSAEAGEEPCANPDDYVFWDHMHPNYKVHQIIANLLLEILNKNNIVSATTAFERR